MEKLLVVGDIQLAEVIQSGMKQYEVLAGVEPIQALEHCLRHTPSVVIVDLAPSSSTAGKSRKSQGESDGQRFLEWLAEGSPHVKVVVLTAKGDLEAGNRAVQSGAFDFHQKPIEISQLRMIVSHAFQLSTIEEQTSRLQQALEKSNAGIEDIAGQCKAMRELFSLFQNSLPQPSQQPLPESVERAVAEGPNIFADGGAWQVEELSAPAKQLTLREVRDRVEKGMISEAVDNCGGNIVKASELLGVSRPALYDLMKKHGLFKPAVRQTL
jgi:DNA-binding NtrC family response regulator